MSTPAEVRTVGSFLWCQIMQASLPNMTQKGSGALADSPIHAANPVAGIATDNHTTPSAAGVACVIGGCVDVCDWALIVVSPLIFCDAPIPPLSSVMRQNYQTSHHTVTEWRHAVTV